MIYATGTLTYILLENTTALSKGGRVLHRQLSFVFCKMKNFSLFPNLTFEQVRFERYVVTPFHIAGFQLPGPLQLARATCNVSEVFY